MSTTPHYSNFFTAAQSAAKNDPALAAVLAVIDSHPAWFYVKREKTVQTISANYMRRTYGESLPRYRSPRDLAAIAVNVLKVLNALPEL